AGRAFRDAGPNKEVRREHPDRRFGEDHRARGALGSGEARHRSPARSESASGRDLRPDPGRESPCRTLRHKGRMTTTRRAARLSKRPRPKARIWKILRDDGPVRWSKVQTAQARIASGYYERDEVECAVVSALVRELKRH